MKVLCCFTSSEYTLLKNEEIEQLPQLPKEIIEIIFTPLKLSELSKLARSSKQWSRYAGPYLKLLKSEAKSLLNRLNDTYIPVSEHRGRNLSYLEFPCRLSGSTINFFMYGTNVSKHRPVNPDFVITTLFELHILGDDACNKGCKAFFCLGICEDYCSNDFLKVTNTKFIKHLDQKEKGHISKVLTALNKIRLLSSMV